MRVKKRIGEQEEGIDCEKGRTLMERGSEGREGKRIMVSWDKSRKWEEREKGKQNDCERRR